MVSFVSLISYKGMHSDSTYAFTHIGPARLRFAIIREFPWDTDTITSSEKVGELQKPFTVCRVFQSFRPFENA